MSEKVSLCKLLSIKGIENSKDNTHIFKLTMNNLYISYSLSNINTIIVDKISDYITSKPDKVKIIKKCKVYPDRLFQQKFLHVFEPNDEIVVQNIIYTDNLTPRLQVEENKFITANKKF